ESAQRPMGAETAEAAIHQPGKARLEHRLVAEPPLLHGAWQEILDENVRVLQQPQQRLAAFASTEIQRDTDLVSVQAREVGGGVLDERRTELARFISLRRLDLDH